MCGNVRYKHYKSNEDSNDEAETTTIVDKTTDVIETTTGTEELETTIRINHEADLNGMH